MGHQRVAQAKTAEANRQGFASAFTKPALSDSVLFHPILHLQRTIGNQAVQGLFKSGVMQAKLKIGQPGDIYEQEADRVADQVMRMPEPLRQRQLEEEDVEEILQTKETSARSPEVTQQLESSINAIKSGGQSLSESVRAFFEPRFGYDFSQVRVHTDGSAADAVRTINARAFTVGRDVVFGEGQYAPETTEGKRLIAHELTHVVQQGGRTDTIECWKPEGHRKITMNALNGNDRFSLGAKRILILTAPTPDYNRPQILQDMISFWTGKILYRALAGFLGGAVVGAITPPGQGYRFKGVTVSGVLPQAILGSAGVRVSQELPNHGEAEKGANVARMQEYVITGAGQANTCDTMRGLVQLGYALHTAQDRASHGEGYREGLANTDVPHDMLDTIATNPGGYSKAIANSQEAIKAFYESLTPEKQKEVRTLAVPDTWQPPVVETLLPPLPSKTIPSLPVLPEEQLPLSIPIIRIEF